MRRAIGLIVVLVIFLLFLIVPAGIRYWNYYGSPIALPGNSQPENPPDYDPAYVVELVPTPADSNFEDNPRVREGKRVLLDLAHGNSLELEELGVLEGRLAARGAEVINYRGGDDLERLLRGVDAYVVVVPLFSYSEEEIQAVSDFVDRGGRLLMIGDPARFEVRLEDTGFALTFDLVTDELPLNALANEFDINFEGDYLYNLTENEGNFRNIIVTDADDGESELTDNLDRVVFNGMHSLRVGPSGRPIFEGDENTFTSATDRAGGLTLGATSTNGNVLALGDFDFMVEPNFAFHDNPRLIANIADFLVGGERSYLLRDLPYFYGNEIDLVFVGDPNLGPEAFENVIMLQDAFRLIDTELSLADERQEGRDALYLGLYNQAVKDEIIGTLTNLDVSLVIDPPILTEKEQKALDKAATAEAEAAAQITPTAIEEGSTPAPTPTPTEIPEVVRLIESEMGTVQMSGTSIILLREARDHSEVIILAASLEGLQETLQRILDLVPLDASYALADCLVGDTMALCPTGVADEAVEPELKTGGEPEQIEPEETETAEATETPEPDETPTPEPTEEAGGGDGGSGEPQDIDADIQGPVGLGETVEGELESDQRHGWTLEIEEETSVTITLESGEELDGVLSLYDSDGELVETVDAAAEGLPEILEEIDLLLGVYTIVVHDFFNNGGTYSLSVEAAPTVETPGGTADGNLAIDTVFVYFDDDGELLGDEFDADDNIATLLSENYEVTTWSASADGNLSDDTLADFDLVVWSSGFYREEDPAEFSEDILILLDHSLNGGILMATGATLPLFEPVDVASISDLEVTGENAELLGDFSAGDVIELEAAVDAAILDQVSDSDEGTTLFLLRGPSSDSAGESAGAGFVDSEDEDTGKIAVLAVPLALLPSDTETALVTNMINWLVS